MEWLRRFRASISLRKRPLLSEKQTMQEENSQPGSRHDALDFALESKPPRMRSPELQCDMSTSSESLGLLLARYVPRLTAFVRVRMGTLLRSREASADLVQSVCHELLQRRERFTIKDERTFAHWLFELAERKVQDRIRYHRAEKRTPLRECLARGEDVGLDGLEQTSFADPVHQAELSEWLQRFQGAFERLPTQYRDVIMLSRFAGLKNPEIAKRLGRSTEAVTQALSRALARLSSLLA